MNAKTIVLALVATGLISTQTYAADTRIDGAVTMAPQASFSDAEIQAVFEPSNAPMQLASLSQQEMKDTQGAWGPAGAFVGGLGALGGYTINKLIAGERWSPTTAATLTALGAAAGAFAGPNGVVWGVNSALAGGIVEGVSSRTGW